MRSYWFLSEKSYWFLTTLEYEKKNKPHYRKETFVLLIIPIKIAFHTEKLFWKFYHEPLHFLTLQCPLLIPKMFFTFNITVKYPLIGIICLERYNTLLTKFHPDVTPNSTWRFPTFCVDNHNDFQTFRTLWLHVTKFSTSPEFSHRYTAALLAATCFLIDSFFTEQLLHVQNKIYLYIFTKLNVFPEHLRCPGQIHHSQKKSN